MAGKKAAKKEPNFAGTPAALGPKEPVVHPEAPLEKAVRVFYRELVTHREFVDGVERESTRRDGAKAFKDFDSKKEADAFKEAVGGW